MRPADYLRIALKDIRRQAIRSSLTLTAIAVSTVILVVVTAMSIGGQQVITSQFGSNDSLLGITVTPNQANGSLSPFGDVQQVKASASKLSDTTVSQLAKLPHVQSVTPRAQVWELSAFSMTGSDKQFVAQAEGVAGVPPLTLAAGSMFTANDTRQVVILGYAYAKALGYEHNPQALIGKTIRIVTQKGYRGTGAIIPDQFATSQQVAAFNQTATTIDVPVIGVTTTGPDQNGLYVPLSWAHAIRTAQYNDNGTLKTTDQLTADGYTTLEVKADTVAHVSSVASAIRRLGYGEVSVLSQVQHIQQFSTTMWILLSAVAIIAVIAAALGVINTMLMAVSEQTYAIGVWRACGARKQTIVGLFLTQAGILGCLGGGIGVLLGVVCGQFVNTYVDSLLQTQGLSATNIVVVSPQLAAGAILFTTIFGIIAGVYPAYRAARQDPSRALSGGQ